MGLAAGIAAAGIADGIVDGIVVGGLAGVAAGIGVGIVVGIVDGIGVGNFVVIVVGIFCLDFHPLCFRYFSPAEFIKRSWFALKRYHIFCT